MRNVEKRNKIRVIQMKTLIFSLLTIIMVLSTGCSNSSKSSEIHIATKGFTESDIMANMLKLLIENDTKLTTKISKLDNNLLWEGIKSGQVDTYVEYSGTALISILKEQPEFDPKKVFDKVVKLMNEKEKITILDPIGFNDTYAFAIHKDIAEKYGIKNTSDMAAKAGELKLGAGQDFLSRPDVWPYVMKIYNPQFKEIKNIENEGLRYRAVEQKLVDTIVVYTTDSKLTTLPMVVLDDDKHVFLPYDAIPIVRNSVLEKHSELKNVLNKLAGKINFEDMQHLNGEVDLKQRPAFEVAKEWLVTKGLIQG